MSESDAAPADHDEKGTDPPVRSHTRAARHAQLAENVRRRATQLQTQSTGTHRVSGAVSALAQMRQAVGKPVGSVAEVWDDTLGLVPGPQVGRTDLPNAVEQATHHAMTLFAVHRQGSTTIAHRTGVSLGTALIRLARARSSDNSESEGVRRRFDALLTAVTPDEAARHLRGIVTLLKSEDVAVDYGLLASDLADLWTQGRGDAVRLRWARDYRRDVPSPDTDSSTAGNGR